MKIGIAADHGGFDLKQEMHQHLVAAGYEVIDYGAHKLDPLDDYPDFVGVLAKALAAGQVQRGIAIC